MDLDGLRTLYEDRGTAPDITERALETCAGYMEFLAERGTAIENASVPDARRYLDELERNGVCDAERVMALGRAHFLAGNNEAYIYFTQVIERTNIINNVKLHVESVLGPNRAGNVFASADPPSPGAPPEEAPPFTRRLVDALQTEAEPDEAADALRGNAHGIPRKAFAEERKRFLESSSLDEYLAGAHARAVATLEEHARTGKVWFEQEITDQVVEFVRTHPEVLGGVRDGDTIYWTKIPFSPKEWLAERNPERRRYLACHCPMARESLNRNDTPVPGLWCTCTAGFLKQRFDVVFGEDTRIDVLESVLNGDDRCRFAVRVPPATT